MKKTIKIKRKRFWLSEKENLTRVTQNRKDWRELDRKEFNRLCDCFVGQVYIDLQGVIYLFIS